MIDSPGTSTLDVVKCAPGEEGTWPLVEPLPSDAVAPDVLRWTVR